VRGKVPSSPSPCQQSADDTFAGDLSEQEKKFFWATHFAPAADVFTQKLDGVAWRSKPSSYIVEKGLSEAALMLFMQLVAFEPAGQHAGEARGRIRRFSEELAGHKAPTPALALTPL
jgi:hypothetical protein